MVGGSFVRSLGDWAQVLSVRRRGGKVASDELILGSSEFVKNIISDAERREKETLRLSFKISDLSSLAREIAEGEGLESSELR